MAKRKREIALCVESGDLDPTALLPEPVAVAEFLEAQQHVVPTMRIRRMRRPAGNMNSAKQEALRIVLGRPKGIGNDIAINCRPYCSKLGRTVQLSMDNMKELYESRREHVLGHNKLMVWMRGKEHEHTPKTGVYFWYSLDNYLFGTPKAGQWPTSACDGCRSSGCGQVFDKRVLLTYDLDVQIPPNWGALEVVDAEAFLNKDKFDELLKKGVPVQILADYCRLRYIYDHGGWCVDFDVLWLRMVPDLRLGSAPNFGHFAASTYVIRI